MYFISLNMVTQYLNLLIIALSGQEFRMLALENILSYDASNWRKAGTTVKKKKNKTNPRTNLFCVF